MKIVIPLAGKGTRLRPHTHTVAKPLMHLAGKPVLGHIFDQIKDVEVDEIIFITGYLGNQIKEYVKENYKGKARFIEQKEMLGQAHAIYLAKEHLEGDAVIWFVDTISDADLNKLNDVKTDGAIYVKEVENPKRFGQIKVDSKGIITETKEKADPPISNLVNIGIYYVSESKKLVKAIEELMEKNMQTKGEFYLMDAFQLMIENGAKFEAPVINVWEDCGKANAVIKSNKYLLDKIGNRTGKTCNSNIIPPVYIEDDVEIDNSIIGPYVSVASGARIKGSIIENSIVGLNVQVKNANLKETILAKNSTVVGSKKRLNIGEDSEIFYD